MKKEWKHTQLREGPRGLLMSLGRECANLQSGEVQWKVGIWVAASLHEPFARESETRGKALGNVKGV